MSDVIDDPIIKQIEDIRAELYDIMAEFKLLRKVAQALMPIKTDLEKRLNLVKGRLIEAEKELLAKKEQEALFKSKQN